MLALIAKTRDPLTYLRTIIGIFLVGVSVTWGLLNIGVKSEVIKLIFLVLLTVYVFIFVVLHQSKFFNVTGDVVKRIAPLLLVVNLAEWSEKGFNYWIQSLSILSALYLLLYAYEKFHLVNRLSHYLVMDPSKEFVYNGKEEDSEEDIKGHIMRAYASMIKNVYRENVIIYDIKETRDSDGVVVYHISFALTTEKKDYHLFVVQIKEDK